MGRHEMWNTRSSAAAPIRLGKDPHDRGRQIGEFIIESAAMSM